MTSIERVPFDINEQINGSTQQYFGPLQYINRCRGCNQNLTSNNPASRYQKLKLIQNTVRVPSSIYTMNLGALNVYQRPNSVYSKVELDNFGYIVSPGVNWNQMSDRKDPHIQKVVSASGSTYGGNSLKRTITRLRPGALSPGGVGVDIKHNSYDRYLARLKGKGPLRRGPVPKLFKSPYIPFNPAYPVYGSKLFKTSIVNGCDCPDDGGIPVREIYEGKEQDEIFNVKYTFNENDIVLAPFNNILTKAKVLKVLENGNALLLLFLGTNITQIISSDRVRIFLFDKCDRELPVCVRENFNVPLEFKYITDGTIAKCLLLNYIPNIPIL